MFAKHLIGCLLTLALTGCGSESTSVQTVSNPATVPPIAPRLDGLWKGTLSAGERLEFTLEQKDPQTMEGNGLLLRGQEPQALDVSAVFSDDGQLAVQLASLDKDRPDEVADMTMAVLPNGSAEARLNDGSAFALSREETRGKLWNNDRNGAGPEVYTINATNDLGEQFHLRFTNTGKGRGTWESLGGVPLWTGTSGTAAATLYDNGQWVGIYLHDASFGRYFGQLVFERHADGRAGSRRELSATDSALNSKESFGWVTGHVTLEVP